MKRPPGHPFAAVDLQDDPQAWIDVLDTVRAEPAYAAYKRRIAELLEPHGGGGVYLEVGVGTGADAVALAERYAVEVVGVDASEQMVAEARRRGLRDVVVADAAALPFDDDAFDGCWADRVFQHLADPEAALRELVRVAKPGGRVVLADPDYATQVVDVADEELARRVLAWRADHAVRNGTLAHRCGGMFVGAGLAEVEVEAWPVVLRDPAALDNALGLRDWAGFAHEAGLLTKAEAESWRRAFDDAAAQGRFLYSFEIFVTGGTKPGRTGASRRGRL